MNPQLLDLSLLLPPSAVLSDQHQVDSRLVATLSALGTPSATIAEKLGLPVNRVETMLSEPANADLVIRLQGSLYPDVQQRIRKLGNAALDQIHKTMLTGAPKERFAAAESLLDRAIGKAIQVTESRNLNINVNDPKAVDAALSTQQARIAKLELAKDKLKSAKAVAPATPAPVVKPVSRFPSLDESFRLEMPKIDLSKAGLPA